MAGLLTFLAGPLGRWLLLLAAIAAAFGTAYWKGRSAGWQAREAVAQQEAAEMQRAAAVLAGKREAVTAKVVVQYRDRVQIVEKQGEEVIREVEKLVPVDACDLPGGWRVLHDAAANGRFSSPSLGDHAAPVAPQDAARTVAENYTACRVNAERLIALQDWVRHQQEITR